MAFDPNCFGLWKKWDKNGKAYLSGSWEGYWVTVFENRDKKSDKHPDFSVKMTPKEQKETDRYANQPGDKPTSLPNPIQPSNRDFFEDVSF